MGCLFGSQYLHGMVLVCMENRKDTRSCRLYEQILSSGFYIRRLCSYADGWILQPRPMGGLVSSCRSQVSTNELILPLPGYAQFNLCWGTDPWIISPVQETVNKNIEREVILVSSTRNSNYCWDEEKGKIWWLYRKSDSQNSTICNRTQKNCSCTSFFKETWNKLEWKYSLWHEVGLWKNKKVQWKIASYNTYHKFSKICRRTSVKVRWYVPRSVRISKKSTYCRPHC